LKYNTNSAERNMRIVRFSVNNEVGYGTLEDSQITRIEGNIFVAWKKGNSKLCLEEARLLAPIQPPNILAIGLNYREHARESKQPIPPAPVLFIKANTSLAGPDQPIILPPMAPNEVDYEAELVIVIGKHARNVSENEAHNYVLGYTCGNDVSARDCQLRLDAQWARGKSFDTFAPMGPWIETEVDADSCRIHSRLNGSVMQDSSTKDLIFNTSQLVSYLSKCMSLVPGTAIMTGTPSGVGFARKPPVFLKAGDTIEVEVDSIGTLRNPVQKEN
jgi:2-keto-4-pentenoate hydratase/2-oxohepta-3-ene-1,7-dioic acid hydratase in catechol pathway